MLQEQFAVGRLLDSREASFNVCEASIDSIVVPAFGQEWQKERISLRICSEGVFPLFERSCCFIII